MKMTINKSTFRDLFFSGSRKNQFSYDALGVIYDFLEECYPDFELDIVAICCDFTEYESLEEFNKEHNPAESIDEIAERTTLLKIDDESFVIQNY